MSEDKFTFESERFIKESLCFFFFYSGCLFPQKLPALSMAVSSRASKA